MDTCLRNAAVGGEGREYHQNITKVSPHSQRRDMHDPAGYHTKNEPQERQGCLHVQSIPAA